MSSGSGLTPIGEAFLAASQLREAVEDLSAADINRMSFSEYSRIREAAGLPSIDPYTDVYREYEPPPGHPRQEPGAVAEPQDPGTDFQNMGMAEYERVRARLGVGRSPSARGLFD